MRQLFLVTLLLIAACELQGEETQSITEDCKAISAQNEVAMSLIEEHLRERPVFLPVGDVDEASDGTLFHTVLYPYLRTMRPYLESGRHEFIFSLGRDCEEVSPFSAMVDCWAKFKDNLVLVKMRKDPQFSCDWNEVLSLTKPQQLIDNITEICEFAEQQGYAVETEAANFDAVPYLLDQFTEQHSSDVSLYYTVAEFTLQPMNSKQRLVGLWNDNFGRQLCGEKFIKRDFLEQTYQN
ncbi:MAG: hypothetical protein Hens3KO_06330 [Henriciella sp.]